MNDKTTLTLDRDGPTDYPYELYQGAQADIAEGAFAIFYSPRHVKAFLDVFSLACRRLCDCDLTVVNHTKVDLSGLVFVREVKPGKEADNANIQA